LNEIVVLKLQKGRRAEGEKGRWGDGETRRGFEVISK